MVENEQYKYTIDFNTAYKNAKSELLFVVYSQSKKVAITVPIPKQAIGSTYYYFGGGIPTSNTELYQAQIHLSSIAIDSVRMLLNGTDITDYNWNIYYK